MDSGRLFKFSFSRKVITLLDSPPVVVHCAGKLATSFCNFAGTVMRARLSPVLRNDDAAGRAPSGCRLAVDPDAELCCLADVDGFQFGACCLPFTRPCWHALVIEGADAGEVECLPAEGWCQCCRFWMGGRLSGAVVLSTMVSCFW
ncbi:hypothetical protein Nepgr_008068 [Nepenthes gracilis]|uniref:Uncharacterized protein n=1 Tax=Nepenthes gracilis TaxID=150966 RepID=A0AAD3S806_NEPGR|nr:hypothetical protein Nepgr_008068 [Nepenthes gracilis]